MCACVLGCSLDSNFGDLGEKLLDPEIVGLDTPGQRLLDGPYYDLAIQADETGARYAMARNEEGELAIADFAAETYCRAGSIARYGAAITARGERALIPLLVLNEADEASLTFSDFACQRSAFSVRSNGLPVATLDSQSAGSGTALLIKTPEQGLSLIDPWDYTVRPLAESVPGDPISAFSHFLWVDRGVIVVSDDSLVPVAYYGESVSEYNLSSEDAELAYVEADPEGGPGGRLFVVSATSQRAPRELASDACGVRYLTFAGRRVLAYSSPCEERRLVFQDRSDASIRVIGSNVSGNPVLRTVSGESVLTYVTTDGSNTATGTLWLVRGDAEPIIVAENARVSPSAVTAEGGLLTVLDWSSTGGRLVEWKDEVVRDVADDVFEIGTLGTLEGGALTLLGNYDGTVGDLMRLNADLSTDVLANGVPLRAAEADAFLANFDGATGELRLLDRGDGSSELLGTGVARGSFGFAQQFSGIIMLTDRDPETNTSDLRLRLLESGREYRVNAGVTETREVAFPSPGLLYNVAVGDDAGVWFSKAL